MKTMRLFAKQNSSSLFVTMFVMMFLNAVTAKAGSQLEAKIYMTYSDFVKGKSISVDSLVNGRTHQILQLREEDYQIRVKSGDKEVDKILKQQALVLEYGGHLYVNSRYLRCNDIPLDVSNYTQAFRYDGNKLCVVAHWINTAAVLADLAGTVTAVVSPIEIAIPVAVGTAVLAWNFDKLCTYRCYCIDCDANAKGRTPVTRMDDAFMSNVLRDSPDLLARYNALDKKRQRTSAANILPFLKEKKLISEL